MSHAAADAPRAGAQDVERLSAAAARLHGRRAAAAERLATLTAEVAVAKGRVNARPLVEPFLEQVQESQNRRNVSTFETLLTALAREVLPWADPIRLDLRTERNLPALDIAIERPGGEREDVFEDQGGALTNVVSAGLRLIAVVKSRASLFVALDEADCWISPDRVPVFYRVLEDAAARLGVQCLAISHHDIASFDADIRVSRIAGHPGTGVTVGSQAQPPEWPEDRKGLRSIRLVNVQGYEDATLVLSPGVNAVTGPNNHGKSTFARALRAMFLGEGRDSLIRHGARSATVEVAVEGGRTLRYVRSRRTPVNLWSLHDAAGEVVVENGVRHETDAGRGNVPDWVATMFGIAPVQDLDVHIAHQKRPVFLLGESGPTRASVLSVGQEADHARRMIEIQKERSRRDVGVVREGEREIDQLRRLVAHLKGADALESEIERLRRRLASVERGQVAIARAEAELASLLAAEAAHRRSLRRHEVLSRMPAEGTADALARGLRDLAEAEGVAGRLVSVLDAWTTAHARAEVMDALPEAPPTLAATDGSAAIVGAMEAARAAGARASARSHALADLPAAPPTLAEADTMIPLGKAVRDARVAHGLALARSGILASLPVAQPVPAPTAEAEGLAAGLARHSSELDLARARGAELGGRMDAMLRELEEVLVETGGACPACGRPVEDVAMLVEGHAHP